MAQCYYTYSTMKRNFPWPSAFSWAAFLDGFFEVYGQPGAERTPFGSGFCHRFPPIETVEVWRNVEEDAVAHLCHVAGKSRHIPSF